MTNRTDYPFTAWILTPGYSPKEVTITDAHWVSRYLRRDNGGSLRRENVFDTREECIAAGFRRLDEADARLEKQKASSAKRRVTLEKAKR